MNNNTSKKNTSKKFKDDFYNLIPFNVAIIDKKFNVIDANRNFINTFGEFTEKKCFQICKKSEKKCSFCRIEEVFKTGKSLVANETVFDSDGDSIETLVYFSPVKNEEGRVTEVIEMSYRIVDSTQWQRDYNILFERVPNYITIIDKNFKIVRANKKFRDTFGEARGQHCYKVYKNRRTPCKKCPAAHTFRDGYDHSSAEVGISMGGDNVHYMVTTTPIVKNDKGVELVMEICSDITELNELENQLRQAHDFYARLIKNSEDGIIGIDQKGKVQIFNDSAKKILDWPFNRKPVLARIKEMFPDEIFYPSSDNGTVISPGEGKIKNFNGKDIPVRLNVIEIKAKKNVLGRAVFIRDMREIKNLEIKNYEAENLNEQSMGMSLLNTSVLNVMDSYENKISSLLSSDVSQSAKENNIKSIIDSAKIEIKRLMNKSKEESLGMKIISPNDFIIDFANEHYTGKADLKFNPGETKPRPIIIEPDEVRECLNLLCNILWSNSSSPHFVPVINCYVSDMDNENLELQLMIDSEYIKSIPLDSFELIDARKIIRNHGGNININIHNDSFSFILELNRPRLELIAEQRMNIG